MTDPIPELPDDLDGLLAPPAAGPAPELRDALFRRTERTLARGRLVRRLTTAGLIAAVFVVGGLLGWVAKPDRETVRVERVPSPPEVVTVPVVVPVPVPESPEPPRTEIATAAQAELLAEQADDRAEAARLYRLAGDRYLDDDQDYRNAARCYRLFLARVGDNGLSSDPADTWLLTSLKNAAFKEKFDVLKTDG